PSDDAIIAIVRGTKEFEAMSCCDHASDCAVHNEPAYPAGDCNCKE
ncbi:hypothetical protein LCGC14_2824500, partial [marine sediment metagenome]